MSAFIHLRLAERVTVPKLHEYRKRGKGKSFGHGLSSERVLLPVAIGSILDRLIESFSPNDSVSPCVSDCFLKLLLADPGRCDIEKRAERGRDPESDSLFDIRQRKGDSQTSLI